MRELNGRVAVITGGGSGIGEALGRECASAGMQVVLADVEEESAERVAASLRDSGQRAIGVAVDVRDPASVEALAERTYDEYGACHLLANNAGVVLFRRAEEMEIGDWTWVLQVNLMGVVHGVSAFLPRMRAQGDECHIVNTGSVGTCLHRRSRGMGDTY